MNKYIFTKCSSYIIHVCAKSNHGLEAQTAWVNILIVLSRSINELDLLADVFEEVVVGLWQIFHLLCQFLGTLRDGTKAILTVVFIVH